MKNKLISNQKLKQNIYNVIIELIPETEIERVAISNVEATNATPEEKQLIDNYLLFNLTGLGSYSFISLINQDKNYFTIEFLSN